MMDPLSNQSRDSLFALNMQGPFTFPSTTSPVRLTRTGEPGDISFPTQYENFSLALAGDGESSVKYFNSFLGLIFNGGSPISLSDLTNLSTLTTNGTETPATPDKFAEDGMRMPKADDRRPPGDTRTAEEIVKENPALSKLKGRYKEDLKKHCGDWENEPDPQKRADAAYRATEVLEYIDTSTSHTGGERNKKNGDGEIEGWNKKGKAVRHGTEAHLVQEFCDKGYDGLRENHRLEKSNDKRVREDGSVKPSKWKKILGTIADAVSFMPWLSNTLHGIRKGDGVWDSIKGGFEGYAKTIKDGAIGAGLAIAKGRVDPLSIAAGAYKGAVVGTDLVQRHVPDEVKDVIKVL